MTEFMVKLNHVIWSTSWHGCRCRIMLVTRGWSLLDNCLHCSLRCGTLFIVFHAWMHSSTDVVVKLLLWHYLDYCLQDLFKRMNGELKKSVDMTLAKANRSTQFDIAKVCDPLTLKWVLSLRCIPRCLYGKGITWSYSSIENGTHISAVVEGIFLYLGISYSHCSTWILSCCYLLCWLSFSLRVWHWAWSIVLTFD